MRRWPATVMAAPVAMSLALLAAPASYAAAHGSGPRPGAGLGVPWQPPAQPRPDTKLAVLGSGQSSAAAAIATASARARATGRQTQATGLTTPTTTVTALPNGTEVARTYVLPVRVRQHRGWVAVDTSLHRAADGNLVPVAIPADAVAFSAGGTGPAAVISAGGTRLALSWPGRLPAPKVSGASATYRDVLPGVDLVLTATSAAAGGFSEVLVVHNRSAASDPRLAQLALRVSTAGTAPLRATADGGLMAAMGGGRGAYVAAAPRMWDSSSIAPRASVARLAATLRGAQASARQAGASLAALGSGPAVSSVLAPAGGAQVAAVPAAVSSGGRRLSLAIDKRLLTAPSTRFPVFIDPGFTTTTGTGGKQAYDPVQSGSGCTGSHYNSSSYSFSPVGYDNFEAGSCQYNDTDYALYRVGIPSGVFGSHAVMISASFQTSEAYTSSCSASASVTTSWIGTIGTGTGWPGPGPTASNHDATTTVGPDSGSCNTVEDTSKRVAAGFNVLADMNAVGGSPTAITFRLWEKSNTNDVDHKQFADNPDLQIVWTQTPNDPSSMKEASSSSGTGSLDCDTNPTDPNLPRIGKTDSVSGPYLLATYGDGDGASVQANIRYWNYTTGSAKTTVTKAIDNLTTGDGEEGWHLPSSYTTGLANGTVVAWQAQSETGSGSVGGKTYGPYSSDWTPVNSACYFAVYPNAPDAPALAPSGFTQTTNQAVGSQIKFTITQSAGDTATEFVWSLDHTPPATGPPAAQTCTTSAATAACTKIASGAATLTINVPSPGPHDLWVYELDAAGNESGTTNGAAPSQSWTFSGAGDPNVSYTSAASLQANFAGALTAGQAFDNTMISTASAAPGSANFDGGGRSFDEAELKTAGWNPGGHVTVDGATFTLPNFGSSTSGPDNLLAANQTIGAGPNGAQGSAVEFLASSNNAVTQVGGLATDSPDSGLLFPNDATVPAVMGGTAVTGNGCTNVLAFNPTAAGTGICVPATGTINYATAPGCPAQQQYALTVPDWTSGPSDIAALETPSRDTPSGQQADGPKIYAFAVPVAGSCTVTSITLPDVGSSVDPVVSAGGVTTGQPGLHILGVAVRNTTTATPEVSGSQAASPSGSAWTGAFEAPTEDAFAQTGSPGNETVRMPVSTNIAVPAGAQIRIRLSDPGFTSADGAAPLQIGAATVATDYYQAIPGQTPVALTFGGSTSVTIPVGGDVYSDPLPLPFAWSPGQSLLISLWLKNATLTYLPGNAWPAAGSEYLSASGSGNQTGDTTGTPFSAGWNGNVTALTGVDVTSPAATLGGIASPGAPTVVVAGNNVIDGWTSGNTAMSDSAHNPSQRLAGQLGSQGLAAGYGTVDAGLGVNQVLADLPVYGGMSLLTRLDRDVLAEPDVGTVVIDQGLQDVLTQAGSTTMQGQLENAYTVLEGELTSFGVNVITADLTPCGGYSSSASSCSSAVDGARQSVNSFVDGGGGAPNCPALFDAAVSNGASPEALLPAADAGDHVNLSGGPSGGYAALAPAVGSSGCPLMPNATPLASP